MINGDRPNSAQTPVAKRERSVRRALGAASDALGLARCTGGAQTRPSPTGIWEMSVQTTITTLSLRLSRRLPSQLLCYQPLCICGLILFSLTAAHSADEDGFSLFVAGDMIVMRPLSNSDDPRFLQLVHEIRNADVAVVNIETLFHQLKVIRKLTAEVPIWLPHPKLRRIWRGPALTW